MTNFTNCLMAEGIIQNHGSGLERWDLLNENYASTPETFEGMQALMQKVWYSQAFTLDPTTHDFWFTEWYDEDYSSAYLYKNYALCENEAFCDTVRKYLTFFDELKANRGDNPNALCYTTHTSVYDLASRTLRVLVHEGMDGQTQYFQASLNGSGFPKPLDASK